MNKRWVDPPSGWKYGFPKIWDGTGDFREWLVAEGYPQKEMDSYGDHFPIRWWGVEEDLPPHTD